jgi:AcrR family transcriptional regulator
MFCLLLLDIMSSDTYSLLDMMSTKNSRTRILDAALKLITRRKGADVSMAEIARASGLSRQSLYLHFRDRANLMVALVRHTHGKLVTAEPLRRLKGAPTGSIALRTWILLQAEMNPGIWPVACSLEAVRRSDPGAELGWQDRQKHRLGECRQIVRRLHREGTLKAGITQQTAADLLWSITSLRTWEELVLERGWTAARYEQQLTQLLTDALVHDVT